MKEQTITMETMQADHQRWLRAHEEWRHEIARWRSEHAAAAERLAQMQSLLRDDDDVLEEHARTFRQAECAIAAHEREIAAFLAGTGATPQDVLANRHQEQEGEFSRQKCAHDRIKSRHKIVMEQLQTLESKTMAST